MKLKKISWKRGMSTTFIGTVLIFIILILFFAVLERFLIQSKILSTQMAADSISDGTAVMLSKKGGGYDEAVDYAQDIADEIDNATNIDISDITIDQDSLSDKKVNVTVSTDNYYTATGSYLLMDSESQKEYTLSAVSETKYRKSVSAGGGSMSATAEGGLEGTKLLNQYDPAWSSYPYYGETVGTAGCGPTAYAMALSYLLDEDLTPVDVITKAGLTYSYEGMCIPISSAFGVRIIYRSGDGIASAASDGISPSSILAQNFIRYAEEGYPIIAGVWGRNFGKFEHSYVSHIVFVRGVDDSGNILINDPACGMSHTMSQAEFFHDIKNYVVLQQKD